MVKAATAQDYFDSNKDSTILNTRAHAHDWAKVGEEDDGGTTIVIGGGTPDYSSNIGATLGAARMGVPTLVGGYKDTWNNLALDKDAADKLYNENMDLAYDTYQQNLRQANMQYEDYWYQHRQKKQNWEALNNTQVGSGMYGSLNQQNRNLSNTEEDIFNQNLLATVRANNQKEKQSDMDNYNQYQNQRKQNALDFESQRRQLETQYKNAAAEYVTNIFNQLGNYGASKYIDKNGNVTGGGYNFVNELNKLGLGVQSDGNGGWTVDTSAIFSGNPEAQATFDRLTADGSMPLMQADFPGFRRTLEETNKTWQDKSATINKTGNRKTLTAPEYWATENRRYG